MSGPIADAARGILDGHIILSRKLAQRDHYPAIDVLDSISRVQGEVVTAEHAAARRQLIKLLAVYRDVEDLVQIGAYAKGSNPEADTAIEFNRAINDLLRQGKGDDGAFGPALATLLRLAKEAGDAVGKRRPAARQAGR